MQLFIVSSLVFLAIYFSLSAVIKVVGEQRLVVKQRLGQYSQQETVESAVDEELNRPLKERLFQPVLGGLASLFEKVLPRGSRENMRQKLILAGNPGNLGPTEFSALRAVLMLVTVVLTLLLGQNLRWEIIQTSAALIAAGVASYFLPELFLKKKTEKRKDNIQRSLPDVLDLLTVSVEAGLGFDAALAKVVEKMDGVLPSELARVLQEISMGKPRKEALRDLEKRTEVEDLSNFISSVIQADTLGVSIGGVLRLQAAETRQRRRQVTEEKAMKAPVKMIIPLVIFIFPSIFIVILGPALLNIIDTLVK